MDRVNVNTASVEQLCKVRGVGLKQAKAIIYHREMNGPVTKMAFSMMLMGAVHEETWNQLDFSVPSRIQIKRERVNTSLLLLLTSLLLTSPEAEAAELESRISETEFELSKLLTQSEGNSMKKIQGFQQSFPELHKVRKSTAATQNPPHEPRPTLQKTEPIIDSVYKDQFFKLVSPPKPTIHLHSSKSTLTSQSQSPLSMQMDIVTLQLLQEQTSKQIHELQGLIDMQLEFQQLLVQQLATFRQQAAVDQSSRWSATCNAMPRVPPGFEPLIKRSSKIWRNRFQLRKILIGRKNWLKRLNFARVF